MKQNCPSRFGPYEEEMILTRLDALIDQTHAINVEKGFFTPGEAPNVDQQLMLIVSEIGEAHEAYRKGNAKDDKLPDRPGLEVELADAVIRIFNFGRQAGLDIPGAILAKTEFNNSRPFKHGKSF